MAESAQTLEQLQRLLEKRALSQGDFELSSGLRSQYYFNVKKATLDPAAIALTAEAMLPIVQEMDANSVGGLEIGAIPIAIELSRVAASRGHPLPACIVRDEKKKHGDKEIIAKSYGFAELRSPRVAVVDDVITTGASVQQAIEELRKDGCEIAGVIAIVTRPEKGGLERMRQVFGDVPYVSLFTCDEKGNLTPSVSEFATV